MDPIQYTCVFRGVMLVRVPVQRPKIEVVPLPAPKPAASAAKSAAPPPAKKALDTGWKAATGKHPPVNPADPDVAMGEAIAWAVVSGTFVALARMLAQRRAATYYAKSAGHLPPQLQKE